MEENDSLILIRFFPMSEIEKFWESATAQLVLILWDFLPLYFE